MSDRGCLEGPERGQGWSGRSDATLGVSKGAGVGSASVMDKPGQQREQNGSQGRSVGHVNSSWKTRRGAEEGP